MLLEAIRKASSQKSYPKHSIPLPDPTPGVPSHIIPEGQRNTTLFRPRRLPFAGAGLSRIISATLHQINKTHCFPPLPEKEVDGICRSIQRYPSGGPTLVKEARHAETLKTLWVGRYRWDAGIRSWREWEGTVWKPADNERMYTLARGDLCHHYRTLLEAAYVEGAPEEELEDLTWAFHEACNVHMIQRALTPIGGYTRFPYPLRPLGFRPLGDQYRYWCCSLIPRSKTPLRTLRA